MGSLGQQRYEPVDKRIGGQIVVDADRVLLVWEPKRVVPSPYPGPFRISETALTMTPASRSPCIPRMEPCSTLS